MESKRTVKIDVLKHMKPMIENGFTRQLTENQTICEKCKGVELVVVNDYIVSCNNCTRGVINHCTYCNEALIRYTSHCSCGEYWREMQEKREEKECRDFEHAIKLRPTDEKAKEMGCYFHESYPYNEGYFDDIEEFMQWWLDEGSDYTGKPQYVWGTYEIQLSFDALDLVSHACEELHEDALDCIDNQDIEELQDFLNKWCKKQTHTKTYYEDKCYAILLDWSEFDG